MNYNNYDDYCDFFYGSEEKNRKFLEKILGPDDTNPAVVRNVGCKFTDMVLEYLANEWNVEIINQTHEVQDKAIDLINESKNNSPANVAAQIYKILIE